MKSSNLKHGDVLLYEYKENAPLIARGIRLIQGNKFIHCGIVWEVDGIQFILEQQHPRMYSYLPIYQPPSNGAIHCVRPMFGVPEQHIKSMFLPAPYGNLAILDQLLNHLLKRVTFGKWIFKPMLTKALKDKHIDCATLVAEMLDLELNTDWCEYPEVVEPDDYFNHPESFAYLDVVEWL